ncbi:hypothetical protein HRbin06_00135 [archaeon HR06]|nr:hypothetical protein HRbin06_00135 [archaeon HR06]
MGIAKLLKVTLITTKSEVNEILRELSYFEYFHPLQKESNPQDSLLASINLRALKLDQELSDIIAQLNIKRGSLMAEKNEVKEKKRAKDWEDFINNLELEAQPIIREIKELLREKEELEKERDELRTLKDVLEMISGFQVNLDILKSFKYFKLTFSITKKKNLEEIKATLAELPIFDISISEEDVAFLIVASKEEEDRVNKTLRSFEIEDFSLPKALPQNPQLAYKKVKEDLDRIEGRIKDLEENLRTLKEKFEDKILILKEGAEVVREVTDKVKRLEGLRFFTKIEGYIPEYKKRDLENLLSHKALIFFSSSEDKNLPTLFTNKGLVRDFQSITLNQGPPKYTEPDPTPLISFFFPIFYGIMFGDFGGGLILFLLGLFMLLKGSKFLKGWGSIIATSGLVAMLVGLIIGEAFGVPVSSLLPFLKDYHPLLELIDREGGGKFAFNVNTLMFFLKLTLIIGIVHLTLAYLLSILKGLREGSKYELFMDRIPTLILYVSFIIFGLTLFSDPSYIMRPLEYLNSNKSVPILNLIVNIPVALAFKITLPLIILCLIILFISKPLGVKLGKIHEEESMGMLIFMSFIELFEKLIVFISNTVSYTRLAILLFVHAALTLALWLIIEIPPFDLLSLPIIIVGNVGIIALEGLIVYIQDLRLHLYEWFTKFYEGSGKLFTKIVPDLNRLEIEWER